MNTIVDYVWIGGHGELRSKTRVLSTVINHISDIPEWNYDGSSTYQADSKTSEIIIKPCRMVRCPFRRSNELTGLIGLIVLCDAYSIDGIPASCNNRCEADKIFDTYTDQLPWYGLEQEYFIYDNTTNMPIGFNPLTSQGQFYCSVGSVNALGREISDMHLESCLFAGLQMSGTNAEVAPGQWEFQIGPVLGIDAADQLWIARYILEKLSEKFNVTIVYHPKPLPGNWNGSGCHCNFSTVKMRDEPNGIEHINNAVAKLEHYHDLHIRNYGEFNEQRMTGKHETSSYSKFTYGVGDRTASVRIPSETFLSKKGYLEDRRPAANCDPYKVTSLILSTINKQINQ